MKKILFLFLGVCLSIFSSESKIKHLVLPKPVIRLDSKYFSENLYGDTYKQVLKMNQVYYSGESEFQTIKIFRNPKFGKVLVLDDVVQTTTKDEFIYHEMLVHVPLLSHENPKNVLIIGGGDGGALREVLKHRAIERVVMVEIDGLVIEKCKEFMPELSNGAFENEKAEIIIDDGIEFVKNTSEKFDLIIVDSTDPFGPGMVLFTEEFYSYCKNALNINGIIVTQNGVPFLQGDELKTTFQNRQNLFSSNTFYIAPVPTYIGGFMTFGFASNNSANLNISVELLKERLSSVEGTMKYYTPEIHKASFTLPKYIQKLIE